MMQALSCKPASIRRSLSVLPIVAGAAFVLGSAHGAEPAWKPEKAVEFVAINAPGGGSDRILRIMQNVIQTQRLIPVPVNVVNRPGGGGSVAYNYVNQHAGDGHYLVMTNKSIITNNLVGRGPNFRELTPVVHLFGEYISVNVRPDSPIKSGRDLVERLKKDPTALSFGVATSLGNANHQGVVVALKQAGVDVRKLRSVIFPSGGAASTAMLGGHVDVVPITAAFGASLVRNGQVRMIAVAAPQRLGDVLADVPTWREQGYDAVVSNWRGLIGPKGMSAAQVAYWEQAMLRLTESPEWKKELALNLWASEYKTAVESRRYMERDEEEQRAVLTDLGLLKH